MILEMSKKVLVTGGAGFIGHILIKYLLENIDWEIVSIDSTTQVTLSEGKQWATAKDIVFNAYGASLIKEASGVESGQYTLINKNLTELKG